MRLSHQRVLAIALLVVATACSADSPSSDEPDREKTHETSTAASLAPVIDRRRTSKTRLAVVGDFGTGTESEHRVARSIKRWAGAVRVKGIVTTGDNVYSIGHPSSFDTSWHGPYGWVDRHGIEKVGSLGNHDSVTNEGRPVMRLLDMPARRYKRHFKHVDVFVLDSNRVHNRLQELWLKRHLRDSKARWQVAVFHHPPYNCGEHFDEARAVRREWTPLFRRFDVDLVLSGHEHSYQRFQKRRGVTYVVTGGGGASLYDLGGCPDRYPRRVRSAETFHHLRLIATGSRLLIRAVTPGGGTIDKHPLGGQDSS